MFYFVGLPRNYGDGSPGRRNAVNVAIGIRTPLGLARLEIYRRHLLLGTVRELFERI